MGPSLRFARASALAAGSAPGPARTGVARALIHAHLLLHAACAPEQEEADPAPELHETRVSLAASFVGGRAAGLRRLLHSDLIVQPPAPDSALGGAAAAEYLVALARGTAVSRSLLAPRSLSREGGFLLERGGWHLAVGDRAFASRYTIRWRESPAGWKVVLWRWTRFQ